MLLMVLDVVGLLGNIGILADHNYSLRVIIVIVVVLIGDRCCCHCWCCSCDAHAEMHVSFCPSMVSFDLIG